jgi:hypothetical protein
VLSKAPGKTGGSGSGHESHPERKFQPIDFPIERSYNYSPSLVERRARRTCSALTPAPGAKAQVKATAALVGKLVS